MDFPSVLLGMVIGAILVMAFAAVIGRVGEGERRE